MGVRRVGIAVVLLLVASAASYLWLLTSTAAPSWLRNPIAGFVEPGTTLWWFTAGRPFQTGPRSPAGIALASAANAAFWVAVVALAQLMVKVTGRRTGRR